MEYIKKEELIKGEVYRHDNGNLVQYLYDSNETHIHGNFIGDDRKVFRNYNDMISKFEIKKLQLATPEEKHWLLECIKLDKFITFEEAMKTFVPEYYEYINKIDTSWKFGKIYKINKDNPLCFESGRKCTFGDYLTNTNLFKPSTKEAYDAQFVVKEPLPQFKVIETIETITKVENNEGNQFFIGDVVKSETGLHFKIIRFKYSEDKTKLLAIATDNYPEVFKDINEIEHYIESKVVESNNIIDINIAKNSHYGLYPLTPEECYQFNESLLEKAKRLYPVGTKYKVPTNLNTDSPIMTLTSELIKGNGDNIYGKDWNKDCHNKNGAVYFNGVWAEIIEYPHSFKIGDKIKLHSSNEIIYKIINIEDNVLFYDGIHKKLDKRYKNHYRILAKNAIKVN